jgi:ribonuclease J
LSYTSKTKITFYGGINEIGGNKFLIEDKGTKIFLDFGMQMNKFNQYFAEFVNPRKCNGMGDLFEFELLPHLEGLYRRDCARRIGFGGDEETEIDAIILTHAHVDHCAYIHYLRPEIHVYCSEATKLLMQAIQEVGEEEDYLYFDELFQIYTNKNGTKSRCRGKDYRSNRNIKLLNDYTPIKIDSIEVQPLPVDHSLPGVDAFVIHTSNGSIGYTADIRFHGRQTSSSEKFLETCTKSDLDLLLCEGTRISEESSLTELDVEQKAKNIMDGTKGLVICNYPGKDLDRLLSFYNAAKNAGRDFIIDLKQAYILKLFQTSEQWRGTFPDPRDHNIKIYIPRRGWGLIDKDMEYWTKKILLEDYDNWTDEFLDYSNKVHFRYVKDHQKDSVFYCNDFHVQELIAY